jgi:hypothetical protein
MFLLQKTVLKRMDKGGGFFWQEVVLKENITWLDGRKSANQ